jgi:hypothetical protein
MASIIPQELNWVEKRAACTAPEVFHQICEGVIGDAAAVNAVRQLPVDAMFKVDTLHDGVTIVVGQLGRSPRIVVRFALIDNRIMVTHHPASKPEWYAAVSLNNEGRCTLRLEDSTELEQWQFRKKALEGIFFGD